MLAPTLDAPETSKVVPLEIAVKALSAAVLGFEIDVPDGLIGKLHGIQ